MNRSKDFGPVVTTLWLATIIALMIGTDARADFTFGEPVDVASTIPVLDAENDVVGTPSADGLEMYIDSYRAGGYGQLDIWVLRRSSLDEDWGEPENLGSEVNTESFDDWPNLSRDGLTLYFSSQDRPEGYGGHDLYKMTRATINDPWGPPENLGPVLNTSLHDGGPCVSADGLELYFHSKRPGGYGNADIYVARRETVNDPWGEPENLGPQVNGPYQEGSVALSPNGLVLFFSGYQASEPQRAGGYGGSDIWMTRRASISEPWQEAVNLGPAINTSSDESTCGFWPDGSALVYCSSWGGWHNWELPVIPVVDFTGDSRVDIDDLSVLIEHWGQNEYAYDMSPAPWGDGVIDAMDLEVLMSHWGQDDSLLAHWKLDETGGDIAYDSANENHATAMGDPIWQRLMGRIDGALQLDGIDDYLAAPFILDPVKQPFSVFAWIKGGQPGQAIISQQGAFGEWLFIDATGALAISLTFPLPPVTSNAIITDDQWHHVGLVSDGSGMSLYVDNAEVARSETSPILPSTSDLQIGAGKNLESGAFWSGLIDDVRIYDRATKP